MTGPDKFYGTVKHLTTYYNQFADECMAKWDKSITIGIENAIEKAILSGEVSIEHEQNIMEAIKHG